jgi:RHS repeat-associated protein
MTGSLFGRGSRLRMRLSVLSSLVMLVAVLVPSAASAAECTDTWKGPVGGQWSTAANWSTGKVPTTTDVACLGGGSSVKIAGFEAHVAVVQSEGTITTETSGYLETLSTGEASSVRNLVLNGGGPRPIGVLNVTENLTWGYGGIVGSGSVVILPGATGEATWPSTIWGRLVNRGTLTVYGIMMYENAEIVNEGTMTVNTEPTSEQTIRKNKSAVNPKIVNRGLLQKISKGTGGGTWIEPAIENFGTVVSRAGTLGFDGGSPESTGAWEGLEGGAVTLAGGSSFHYELKGGSWKGRIQDGGSQTINLQGVEAKNATFLQASGTLAVTSGTVTVESLTLSGGAVAGAGTLAVSETLSWTGGSVASTGSTVILPGAKATSEGANDFIQGRLVNRGSLSVPWGMIEMVGTSELVNQGTMTVNSQGERFAAIHRAVGSTAPRVINEGTLQKTSGTGTTQIETPLERISGSITAETGKLEIQHPITVKAGTATPGQACYADPVNCATGNFFERQTDFSLGGRGVGLVLSRTYNSQTASALGIFGYGWTNSFGDTLTSGESGAKQTLTGSSGTIVTFTKSGSAWLAPSWSADVLSGSTESGFTLTQRDQTKEKFNGSGRLESVADRNGNETTLAYNGSGKLETITDPTGRKITLTYNAEGLVEKATDPMGHVVKYTYESKQLKSATLPGETSPNWQFGYDGSHRMTSFTDGRGGKTTNEYAGTGQVISQTDPAGRKTTFSYAIATGFHTTITNKATGAVTDEWFNSNDQPTSITRGFGTASATTESFTYTTAGLLASKTDGNGHTTTYEYDATGNRIKETDPEGDETRWTFNEAHQLLTATTPNGEKTTIVRDANGHPETVSRPAPESKTQTVSFAYGPHGEVETMTDPLGHVWSYEYDGNGDRTAATDPEGDKRTWAYDEDSRIVSSVSPRGNEEGAEAAKFTTSAERDAQGRPIKVTDPLGGATKYAYDADGNVESVTDPNGRKTKFTYDADNELTKVERANKAVEETGYDGAGAITSQTDGNKQKTSYVRNILEQPVETIDPLERKTTRTFDAAGNLKTKTDPEGRTTTYVYDKANRLKEVTYSAEPGQDATFSYDKDGNLTGMVDGTGTSSYEYDQLDRLTHSKDGNGETDSWAYNLGNELVGLTYPNGKSISRAYDKAGRLESVTDWLGHTTSFAYNSDSAPTLTTFPVATTGTDEYSYDRADRMASVTTRKGAETLASLAYSRDPAGQLESLVSKGLSGAETEAFSYDENERLTKAGAAEYGYDAANNPTKAPGTTNAFDKASQLESATGATFTYDKEGERTKRTPSSGPATAYKYGQAGSLTAVERSGEGETPAIAESFAYDGTGLMASRTVGLSTHHLVWDFSEAPELLLTDGEASYIYGPGGLAFEQISSEEVPTYLHHDQLGSTRLLTNGSGESVGTFTYGPYGGVNGHTGTAAMALGYAGQYTLGQSGLIYLRARFYDPATAQFLTLDPEVPSTRAPYSYANDNPANLRDRSGRAAEAAEGGCPPPICYPFPTSAEAESAAAAIGGIPGEIGEFGSEIGSGVSSVWSSVFGSDESSAEEADGEAAEEVPCAEETTTEIGDRQQQRDKDRALVEKERQSQSTNPSDPSWPPSGGRIAKVIAVIGRLFGLGG